jgi:hypothetical protein
MSLTNLRVYSDTVDTVASEMLAQQVDLFNAASSGGIVLRTAANRGDYASTLKYQKISGLIAERDPTSSAAVSALDLVRILEGSVKLSRRVGPVNLIPSDYDWIMRSPEEAGATVAAQVAADRLGDMLNSALTAFVAATLNVGTTLYKDMGATSITLSGLADGAQLLGDVQSKIACWVMHSKTWTDLYKAGITGSNTLFQYGTVNIVKDPLGRPFIITDSTNLISASDYYTCGLVSGGIVVEDNGDMRSNTVVSNLTQNIAATYQGQYSYNLGLLGYKWDETNGGRAPVAASIATGTNWDKTATSVKDCAGVVVIAH